MKTSTKKPKKRSRREPEKAVAKIARVNSEIQVVHKIPDFSKPLDLSCVDWETRVRRDQSLMPDGLVLDVMRAKRARRIFEQLVLPDVPGTPTFGEVGGEWIAEFVEAVFGTWNGAERVVTEFFELVPKKNSKTTNGAGIMVTALIVNQRPRAEFLLIAPTQAVANLAFQQAVGMIEADDELKKRFHIKEYIKRVEFIPTGASLMIKSFDPTVVTGVKPAGILIDELHVISDHNNADRVLGQLRGGLVSQPEGFLIFITTQSERPPSGIFRSELMKARKIRDGKLKGMKMLPIIYEFPDEIIKSDKWKDTSVWHMVLPNAGRSVTVPRLLEDYKTAVENGEEELRRWASQHLNIEIGIGLKTDHWAAGEYWLKGNKKMTLDQLLEQSEAVTVGIDGGGLEDMLALTVVGRLKTGGWCSWNHSWLHADAVKRHKHSTELYDQFSKEGDLTVFEDMGDDLEELADVFVKKINLTRKLGERSIGIDPAGIGAIIDALSAAGIDTEKQVIAVPQGWRLTAAIQTVERKLADGTLTHSEQSLSRWAVENAKVEPRGNAILITKQMSGRGKIDPLMALFNAVELMGRNPSGEKSYQMMVVGG